MFGEIDAYIQLTRRRAWTAERIRDHQDAQLRDLLRDAGEHVAYYRQLLGEAGVPASRVRSVEDLRLLPVTRKRAYLRHDRVDRLDRRADPSRCDRITSSGSTGTPITVWYSRAERDRRRANRRRARIDAGARHRDRELEVGPLRPHPRDWRMAVTRPGYWWLTRMCGVEDGLEAARRCRADIVWGIVSQLVAFALRAREQGVDDIRPRLVFTGGETLNDPIRELIRDVFRAPLRVFFGAVEFGIVGSPCALGNGWHVASDDLIVECLRDGVPVEPGEAGELVVTSLTQRVMPLIRYSLGDIVVPGKPGCACGNPYARIDEIQGRTDDLLVRADGRLVSPFMANQQLYWREEIRQFRVIQEAVGHFRIEYEADRDLGREARSDITGHFREHLDAERVEIERVDAIPREPSGKIRKIISRIPSAYR